MKSKGPVDFFLGVFLEFGAAFCLLFFLPQVPWRWLPEESGREPTVVNSPPSLSGVAATERRVSLLPLEPSFTRPKFALSLPTRREAPALLPAEVEPEVSFSSPRVVPPAGRANQDSAERATSFYHREMPRRYQY